MSEDSALMAQLEARRGFEEEVIAAERAFCIRAAYDGIRTAFLSVLAEDSVVAGDGPAPGRATYEALPRENGRRLLWEPQLAAASADGTLALTTGPYRMLDAAGEVKSSGIYFSVWRRHPKSAIFELVLDFGAQDAAFPDPCPALSRPEPSPAGTMRLEQLLAECVREGQCPEPAGSLLLGAGGGEAMPVGCLLSADQELGVLWGALNRGGGVRGVFAQVLAAGEVEPIPLVYLRS